MAVTFNIVKLGIQFNCKLQYYISERGKKNINITFKQKTSVHIL